MESQLTDYKGVYQQTQNNFFKKRGPVAIIIYLIFETSLQIFIQIYSEMMMKSLFICFLVILSGHFFIEAVECQQNTNIEDCGKIDKQEFYRKIQDYKPDYNIQNKIEQMFPADSNLLMDGLLNNDRSKIAEAIKGNEFKYILSIVPVSLFAILFVILPPLLLFTKCFSLLKCMKKRKQIQPYTKMQIRLPLMFTVIFCLGLVICCAVVLNINRVYGTKYNDYKCSLNLVGDNLVSGVSYKHPEPLVTKNEMKLSDSPSNYLEETSFLGTNKLKQMMNHFKMTLKDLYSVLRINFSQNSKYAGKLSRNLSKISDLIIDMMSTYYGNKIPLIYQFAKPNHNGTIIYESPFIKRFGQKGQNDSSLRSNFSNVIQDSKQGNFMISFQSERILKEIQAIQKEDLGQKINNLGQSAKSIENKIRQILSFTDKSSLWQFSVGSNVVLGFTIISVIIMSFSIIYMVFKNNHDCRIAAYICVLILWIIGLLHFAVAIGFTLSNPAVHHSCHNLYESFNSYQAYNKNILSRQPDNPDLKTIGKCLAKSQSKDYLYQSIINNETQKKLKKIRKILSLNFDGQSNAKYINGNFSKLYSQVYNLRNGVTLDINQSNTQINEIIKKATSVEQCGPDSWFLSVNENPVRFPCQLNATVSTKSTCPSEQNFIARAPGCTGCMEISSFRSAYPNLSEFIHVMNKRYPNCSITQNMDYSYKTSSYVNRIAQLYKSFMQPKSTYLTPILKILTQMKPLQNQTVTLFQDFNKYQQSAKQLVLNQPFLQSADKSILNNEMDCRVIGKAVDRSINILCSEAPTYVYSLRFLYLSTGLIILIICMLTIFLVVRYEKHWEILRKKQIQNQFNQNVEIENPINSSTRFKQIQQQQRSKQKNQPQKEEIKENKKLKREVINAMSLEQKYKYLKNRINATESIKKSQVVQKKEAQIGQKQEIVLQNNDEQNSQISSIQIQNISEEDQRKQRKQTTNI